MGADWAIESFERKFACILKGEFFAEAKFSDAVRDEDLFGLGACAQPGRELDGAAKKIVVLFDRLTGCGPDAESNKLIAILLMARDLALHLRRAFHRGRG